MRHFHTNFAYILAFAMCTSAAFSQSTTKPIPLGPPEPATTPGRIGASYVSIALLKSSIYQDSNWWTNMIEKNRFALVTATLSGNVNGTQLTDKRVSPPIAILKNKSMHDIAWSPVLVENLPVSFSGLTLQLEVCKTADDGVESLVSAANAISQKVPALKVSDAVTGYISAAKLIADFLFDKRLVESKLNSSISIVTAERVGLLAPGRYVVLAGTSVKDYEKYERDKSKLTWDGSRVLFDGERIDDVTYFVLEVRYRPAIYDPSGLPDNALSCVKPWAQLYKLGFIKVGNIQAASEYEAKLRAAAAILEDAQQLLGQDVDFIQAERVAVHNAVRDRMILELESRRADLQSKNPHETITVTATAVIPP